MATFSCDIPMDFLSQLDIFQSDIAEEMINEALPIYQSAIQKALKGSISRSPKSKLTGGLVQSVKMKRAKRAKNGAIIGHVTFAGKDSKGSPNMVKAMAMEYGNSNQDQVPFMQKAENDCRTKVIDAMQEVYNKRVGAK